MDGKVIIGTELDDKGFDKGLKEIQKQDASIQLKLDIAELDKQYQEIQKKIDELNKKATIEYSGTENMSLEISPNLTGQEVQEYNRLTDLQDEIWAKKEQLLATQEQINGQATQQVNIEKNNLDNINKWVDGVMTLEDGTRLIKMDTKELADESRKIDFTPIKDSVENVGNSIEKAIKKVSRWALAIFGIRSAYMFVRQAMSTLSQYDDQMAINVEYIRYLLASALKPIIETIINLAYKLLAYINAIAQAWFGVNLFANASTKAFEKQNKALGGSVKQAKQLQKTIAGFDEMNVLQDNGNVGSGGGGGGVTLPNFPKMEDIEIPKWLQWIIDHKDEVIDVLAGITAGLLAIKLGLAGIQALGIGIAVAGLLYTIQSIIKFIKKPTFKNFIKVLEGIAITVAGVAIAFGAWPVAIAGAVALVVIEIVKHFDEIKKLFNELIKWLDKNVLGGLRTLFGPLGDILYMPIKYFAEAAKGTFEAFYGGIKRVIEGVVKIFKGDFLGGIKDVFGGLLSIMTAPLRGFINGVKGVWGQIVGSINYWKNQIGEKFDSIKNKLISPFSKFIDFVKGLWNKIKGALKDLVNNINKTLSKINPIKIGTSIGSKIGGGIKSLFGFAKGGIVVPKLASGGIINQPGRGVPITSAVGGERGMEGVIPLTDSQQMALLGEAIGKYITIDLTNITQLDGRQIARKVEQINQNNRFVLNR